MQGHGLDQKGFVVTDEVKSPPGEFSVRGALNPGLTAAETVSLTQWDEA